MYTGKYIRHYSSQVNNVFGEEEVDAALVRDGA